MTSEDHDGGQRGAEDGVLTKVEQRQAGGGLGVKPSHTWQESYHSCWPPTARC